MKEELDKKLVSDYPLIFANRDGSMDTTAMCWGFECGDGWYSLLDTLCHDIQWHLDKNAKGAAQVVATQIKEKYGTLRFYYDGGDDYISGMVDMAESMSGNICEVCGNQGKLTGGGWITTRCPTCIDMESKK